MRTIGRRIRSGERSRALCSYCGTRWDRDKLYRDAAGLLVCPQEGRGRDAVTLTRENVAASREFAHARKPELGDPGPMDNEPVERAVQVLYLLQENGFPILQEDATPLMGN
jgi:hypothetical protein